MVPPLEAHEGDGQVLAVVQQLDVGGEEIVAVAVPFQRLPATVHVHAEPPLVDQGGEHGVLGLLQVHLGHLTADLTTFCW